METQAILYCDSSNTASHSSIFNNNRRRTFISSATTLTSGSSGSQITVLPTNETDSVNLKKGADHKDHQFAQDILPSVVGSHHTHPPNSGQSKMLQTGQPMQQSQKAYPPIRTTLWIDRTLIFLGVLVPLSLGICFFLVHSFTDFVSCQPVMMASTVSDKFTNRVCQTKLLQAILQGSKNEGSAEQLTGSLQHECFPIVLVIVALLNWFPHLCWYLAVRQSIFCDAFHVASELRYFRKTAQRELLSFASTLSPVAIKSNYIPDIQGDGLKKATCQMPNGHLSSEELITAPKGNLQLSKVETVVSSTDTGYESEVDLPSSAVMHLPKLRVSRDDNALNLFIAGWQNTDFYIRRFLAKHAVLALFNLITFTFVTTISISTHGEPFSGSFYCRPTKKSTALHICLMSTTFGLNMTAFCLGAVGLTSLVCFFVFYHRNFVHKRVYKESTTPCGIQSAHHELAASIVSRYDENFFSDYIRLLALARMQFRGSLFVTKREVFNLRISYLPGLTRTDFHFVNLLCKENIRHFPDAMYLRVWFLRYVFLCRNLGPHVFGRATSTLTSRLKSEDLSLRFGFRKIRIEVDICN